MPIPRATIDFTCVVEFLEHTLVSSMHLLFGVCITRSAHHSRPIILHTSHDIARRNGICVARMGIIYCHFVLIGACCVLSNIASRGFYKVLGSPLVEFRTGHYLFCSRLGLSSRETIRL
jgi:hypothetical protein